MAFDIHQRITDSGIGRIDREAASVWSEQFTKLFKASPEGRTLAEQGHEYRWVEVLLETGIDIYGLTPPSLPRTIYASCLMWPFRWSSMARTATPR